MALMASFKKLTEKRDKDERQAMNRNRELAGGGRGGGASKLTPSEIRRISERAQRNDKKFEKENEAYVDREKANKALKDRLQYGKDGPINRNWKRREPLP